MSITLYQIFNGLQETFSADAPTAEDTWLARDVTSVDELKAVAEATIPVYYGELERKSIKITEQLGPGLWLLQVTYEEPAAPTQAEEQIFPSFDVQSTTERITQSIATLVNVGPGASDTGRVIGEAGEGVDVLRAALSFEVKRVLARNLVTSATMRLYYRLANSVNATPFYGFYPGEVLYLGPSGDRRTEWELTHRFAVRFTAPAKTVDTWTETDSIPHYAIKRSIDVPEKQGWAYEWIKYANKTIAGKTMRVAVAVKHEQIYPAADFSILGCGTL